MDEDQMAFTRGLRAGLAMAAAWHDQRAASLNQNADELITCPVSSKQAGTVRLEAGLHVGSSLYLRQISRTATHNDL